MADLRDEHGNPIQLTDEHGLPVQLTDEHGHPMHLTGVATTVGSGLHGTTTTPVSHLTPVDYAKHGAEAVVGAGKAAVGVAAGAGKAAADAVTGGGVPESRTTGHEGGEKKQLERSSSSSSSSSEDDGQGGRRKKKGVKERIKETFTVGKHKDKEQQHSFTTSISSTTPPSQPHQPEKIRVEHHELEHEKKGLMDRIKDKLPGHHHSH